MDQIVDGLLAVQDASDLVERPEKFSTYTTPCACGLLAVAERDE